MFSEERGIFKPSLKTHIMTNDVSVKRFSFPSHNQNQSNDMLNSNPYQSNINTFAYPSLNQNLPSFSQYPSINTSKQPNNQIKNPSLFKQQFPQLTATKFDPILPKIIFKRYISNQDIPQLQSKRPNCQIIQQLKVKNINYPIEVQKLIKQVQDKKTQYLKRCQKQQNKLNQSLQNNWQQNSYKQSINQHINTGSKKVPYLPLFGTDSKIFWSHSVDKVILWKYRNSQITNPDVFCILSFQKQHAPITAIYATHIRSALFKNQNLILIAIAFFDQLKFFTFNIQKYEAQFQKLYFENEKTEDYFYKYIQKILVKVHSNFFIEKILIQNNPSVLGTNNNTSPLILFTDGSRDLQIVDLSNLQAFKSHHQHDPFIRRQKIKQNRNQNQIIKILHCKDEIRPEIHYAFVLRKQTVESQIKPNSLLYKIINLMTFSKKFQKKQEMILSIYEWNEKELKNDTLWKKIWNPPRVKKIKEISSKDLQIRLKQNFFDFFRLNANSKFLIADISLVEKAKSSSIFENEQRTNCFLKVTFINGASIMISNFRTLTFASKVMINPYIENSVPIISCQYQNYRGILQKGNYLQSQQQIKNKFNLYIYEPVDIEKQPKYSSIDPVISESNGLMICQQKLLYQNDEQISYKFHESNSRKRINEVHFDTISDNKTFMIFQNSFITMVQTPNIAENLLVLAYLLERKPEAKDKIRNYVKVLIEDMPQSNRISFLKSIIQLLISINNSGKKMQFTSSNQMMLEDIAKEFNQKYKRIDIDFDDTTYLEEKDQDKHKIEQVYVYECEINKQSYQNFVEYLLGPAAAKKEGQFLKDQNISYNGKSFPLKITQNTVNYLMDILIDQSLVVISAKPILRPVRTPAMQSFYSQVNTQEQAYLRNLVQGMNQINQTFLGAAFSKFIIDSIKPFINLPYQIFYHLKGQITKILENFDNLRQFIDRLLKFSSFKGYQTVPFSETMLLVKSLQNALPKFSLLLRLLLALSEVNFYNTSALSPKINSNLTLLNFLFKINPKEKLSQLTVQMLFDQNSVFLDQIEQKLPELNEVKYLRFFKGWKKINSMILEGNHSNSIKKKPTQSTWIFDFFNQNNKNSKTKKQIISYQNQQRTLQQFYQRQKRQLFQIQMALNEYSYEDFQRYFINKNQLQNFAQIVLSKIFYLQTVYSQLKERFHFQDGLYDTFKQFMKGQVEKKPQSFQNKLLLTTEKSQLSSFLKYQQKIAQHQKYIKTYQLIKFLNIKFSAFIDKAFIIYTQQSQRSKKQLFSTSKPNLMKPSDFNQSHFMNQAQFLGQQVQKIVDLVMQKGSQYIKNQLKNKIKTKSVLNVFLGKYRNQLNQENKQLFQSYNENNFLVKDRKKALTKQEQQHMFYQNSRKNMYLQRIEQKITFQSRQPYKFENDLQWMQKNYQRSTLNFGNKQF